jgi:PiT family inorganic phosphate transporter
MEYLIILASMAVAFSIGANDMPNAIGTTVGSYVLSYRRAILYGGIAVAIGALWGGANTLDTVGKGIIDTTKVDLTILAAAVFCAALTVAAATYLSFPVSATQSLVGSLSGTGIAMGLELNNQVMFNIAIVWAMLPLISMAMSFSLYFMFKSIFSMVYGRWYEKYEILIRFLVISSGILVAFSLGTNNIGNVVGIMEVNLVLDKTVSVVLGSISITLGAFLFSKRVILSIGKRITTLDPLRAFVCQLSTSLSVLICTAVGIPVSLSQATVGSVMGCGLTKGRSYVNKAFMVKIVASWVYLP